MGEEMFRGVRKRKRTGKEREGEKRLKGVRETGE